MRKPHALLIASGALALFTCIANTQANEVEPVTKMMYMPNDSDGFLTLTSDECRIPGVKDEYPYKAVNADDQGNEIEGCWVRPPDAPGPFESFVNVFMIEMGSANIATFRQYLFSPEKKRWPDSGPVQVDSDRVQVKATM